MDGTSSQGNLSCSDFLRRPRVNATEGYSYCCKVIPIRALCELIASSTRYPKPLTRCRGRNIIHGHSISVGHKKNMAACSKLSAERNMQRRDVRALRLAGHPVYASHLRRYCYRLKPTFLTICTLSVNMRLLLAHDLLEDLSVLSLPSRSISETTHLRDLQSDHNLLRSQASNGPELIARASTIAG